MFISLTYVVLYIYTNEKQALVRNEKTHLLGHNNAVYHVLYASGSFLFSKVKHFSVTLPTFSPCPLEMYMKYYFTANSQPILCK